MLAILEKSKNFRKLHCFSCLALRQLSSELNLEEKTNEKVLKTKRFMKPHSDRKLKPFKPGFVYGLFKGFFDVDILKYPSVLQEEELQTLLRHSVEVEDYLNSVNQDSEITKNILKDLQKIELFGLSVPQKYGGLGYTETETKFIQECTGVNSKIGRFVSHNEDFGIKLLTLYGTEEQKQKYLTRLASGESFISVAYLEDGPLVDLSSFQATVIADNVNNGFLVNANKKWVHNAHISDLFIVLAKGTSVENVETVKVGSSFFIVEKNSPGVTVHGLKSNMAKEFGLYEIDFKNVFIPKCNILGEEGNAYSMLKTGLSHVELSSAVLCSSLLKKLIHSVSQFCSEKSLSDKPLKQFHHIQTNMALLTSYAYALESVVYFISGRFDLYENSDLFEETIVAKIFAVNALQYAIQKYTQIIGPDSFKSSGILEEALKVLQYYSVFAENNLYLKLLIGSSAFVESAPVFASTVKKQRNPYDNPIESLKFALTPEKKRIKAQKLLYNIKMELHSSLAEKADCLEECLAKLNKAVEEHFCKYGSLALDQETHIIKFAEFVSYIYALTVTLSRASNVFCEGFENADEDIDMARVFGDLAHTEMERLYDEILKFGDAVNTYIEIGKLTFKNKEYPAEHPLSRSW